MGAFIQRVKVQQPGFCQTLWIVVFFFWTEKEHTTEAVCSMQRQYEEFSCEWSSNQETSHCLTFSTRPRTCERTQSRSCRRQPNRTVAFSSTESTHRPTGNQKLELGQHVEYREQRNENITPLNNDVIFNATKNKWQHDTLRGWQPLLHHFKISMRKLTAHSGSLQGIYYLLHSETQIIFSRGLKLCVKSKAKWH